MPPWLTAASLKIGIVALVAVLIAGLTWRADHLAAERDAIEAKVLGLEQAVEDAKAAVSTASQINAEMSVALAEQNQKILDAQALVKRLEDAAVQARAKARVAAEAVAQADAARRARQSNPPSEEMTTVLRDALDSL